METWKELHDELGRWASASVRTGSVDDMCAITSQKFQDGLYTLVPTTDIRRMLNAANKSLDSGEHMCSVALEMLTAAYTMGFIDHHGCYRPSDAVALGPFQH